jgi:HAE1 family hydrophobic/amphiphilic exporter-1
MYLRTGKFTPEEAVLLVLNDFKVVLTTTTLTTVWAFLPLLLASGIIGSFIKSVPIVVSVTLISSLLIALMINHPLAAVLERIRLTKKVFFLLLFIAFAASYWFISFNSWTGYLLAALAFAIIFYLIRWYLINGRTVLIENKKLMDLEWCDDELIKEKLKKQGSAHEENFANRLIHGLIPFNRVLPIYDKYLRKILVSKKNMKIVLGTTGAIFLLSILLPVFGIVKNVYFPASDENYIYINARAATGLNLEETNKIIMRAEEKLMKIKEIKNFSTQVGTGGASGNEISFGQTSSNLGSITINLVNQDERNRTSPQLTEIIRHDLKEIKDATFQVESLSGGPPTGSAFEARILGDDLQVLDKTAKELKPLLSSINGVVDANISLKDSPAEYTFTFDPSRLELYNLNAAYVGGVLRMAISGTEVTKVIKEGKEIKVMARFAEDKIPDLEAIQNLQVLNLARQPVFIKDVAKIELKPSVENIARIDQKRAVTLTAGTDGQVSAGQILSEFQNKLKNDYKLPDKYTIEYGGENEQNTESVYSILKAMLLAGLLIISTLVIQFNSFKRALIVLVTIPLALIGVFFGLAITQISLSFPGLIGILALFGIVVKNAIILIDKINLNLKFGIPFVEAIIDAGKSRLEAIFITSICTIFGMIPITLSNALWQALGSAVIFGLLLSSFLTLFIVPILFVLLIKKNDVKICIEE